MKYILSFISFLFFVFNLQIVSKSQDEASLHHYVATHKSFELQNKSRELIKLILKQQDKILLNAELPSGKLFQFSLDVKIPTKILIQYPSKFIEQEFEVPVNKTLYLTLDALNEKNTNLRPETGTYRGFSGKTSSNLSLLYNIKQHDIVNVGRKSIAPKFQIENQIPQDVIWIALFSRDLVTKKWHSFGPIKLESTHKSNAQVTLNPESSNVILYIWENPSQKPIFLSGNFSNPETVTLPDFMYQFKLPAKTLYVAWAGNLITQGIRIVKDKRINSYGLPMDNNITQNEINSAEKQSIDQLDLK